MPQDQGSDQDPFVGLEEDGISLEELVTQLDPNTTANEYLNADDDVSTCLTFEDTDQWRTELIAFHGH